MPITLYHGSRRWSGPPQIQKGGKGRTEHGPGIYLTTSAERARRYGKVMRVTLAEDLRMIEDATLPRAEALAYARTMRKRAKMVADLEWSIAKLRPNQDLPASHLVNLAVNNEALGGAEAPRMAAWLSGRGIDASLVTWGDDIHGEDWLVVFNPEKILHVEDTRGTREDVPLLRARISR